MSLSLLLLLLLLGSSQTSHFMGTVMTFYPKDRSPDGSVTVVLRYKLNFHAFGGDTWRCFRGNCGSQSSLTLNRVSQESSAKWYQDEGVMTRQVLDRGAFQLWLSGAAWISNRNGISSWRAVTLVDLRNRSDTSRANASPQTTILPLVRVPSNCQRDFNLLAFDPDGDEVRCRYGNASLSECSPCTPASVLRLSPSCTLSFGATSSSDEGPYAVQLVMEDFPRQTITLTQGGSFQTNITTNNAISKIPVQFVLQVDPAVPSCTEGLYLPAFLPPTPANRARLYTPVNQTLDISISAAATFSMVSELLFSGPHNVNQTRSGPGQFTLSWMPSQSEEGESQPICFIVQALSNSTKYHSELRCVIVSVGNDPSPSAEPTSVRPTPSAGPTPSVRPTPSEGSTPSSQPIVIRLTARISSVVALTEEDIRSTVVQQLKNELVKLGLPPSANLTLLRKV
ncbi:uncharacterized protein LOC132995902 [Limanda limanda]|uniref:uncharacterized protein LOC132995902 n=1 Tax=Limanda limanda TaxID=27771 RepID=UPI0029C75ECB|nr:uncharacterized protein LOC132995902 [Limanda limanda]